jgi:hypothetical protein
LPRIDQIVDSTAGCELLCFLDAYSGYNQIKIKESDQPNRSSSPGARLFAWPRAHIARPPPPPSPSSPSQQAGHPLPLHRSRPAIAPSPSQQSGLPLPHHHSRPIISSDLQVKFPSFFFETSSHLFLQNGQGDSYVLAMIYVIR